MKSELISKQGVLRLLRMIPSEENALKAMLIQGVNQMPSKPDRDIPKKPNETTDRAWGILRKQAVCPNCDAYLGMFHFIYTNDKTKVTYCESCGQAIDWEGWEDHEND